MAECNEHENCIAEEKISINSRLEQELLKCEADNRKRCLQLMDQLEHIKQLDEQIYNKQMAMHFPRSFIRDVNPQVEQSPEQVTQNHVDQIIANFEHRIRKTTKKQEEKDEENTTTEAKQIQDSGLSNRVQSFESIDDAYFSSRKSKSPNSRCSCGSEELDQELIDKEHNLTMSETDFKSKKLHFEKLIQKDIMIAEQEINKRKKFLKK